jgi:hypothetical protein
MPVISYFLGIYIRMYHNDHPPPHIHVEYQGHEAFVAISTGDVIDGQLPTKVRWLVKDWCLTHQAALLSNWELAQKFLPLNRIPGADND